MSFHVCSVGVVLRSEFSVPEVESKEKHGEWDPYAPTPALLPWATQCQSRLCFPQSGTKNCSGIRSSLEPGPSELISALTRVMP